MSEGYEIHVVPTKDGKTAKGVFLPNRKTEKKTPLFISSGPEHVPDHAAGAS
jgi:hypothetical protein